MLHKICKIYVSYQINFGSYSVICALLIYTTFVTSPQDAVTIFSMRRIEPVITASQVQEENMDLVGLVARRISSYFHSSFSHISNPAGQSLTPTYDNLSKVAVKIQRNLPGNQTH